MQYIIRYSIFSFFLQYQYVDILFQTCISWSTDELGFGIL